MKKGNKRRKIDHVKHFLLPGIKSIRMTKIENKIYFSPIPFVPYSDVGNYNCANTFSGSDSANIKLSRCDNHGNLSRSSMSQEFTLWSFIASPRLPVTLVINKENYDFSHSRYDFSFYLKLRF